MRTYLCESLEPRCLLSINLGTINTGRLFLPNETAKGTFTSNGETQFQFTVPDCYLQIQMSRTLSIGTLGIGNFWITLEGVGSSYGDGTHREDDQPFEAQVSAGTYVLDVFNNGGPDLPIRLAIAVDHAPGDSVATTQFVGLRSNVGADLGTLSAGTGTFQDFVGDLDRSYDRHLSDDDDMYLFNVPANGSVTANLDELATDPAGGDVIDSITLYRDANQDGVFDPDSEVIATKTNLTPGSLGTIAATLAPGRYGVDVRSTGNGSTLEITGGSNYRMRLTYTPTDHGGNTFATAANLGTVGTPAVTQPGYLSPLDPTDIYKFSTAVGGPFVFNAQLSGMPQGADYLVQLINDANGNLVVDSGEVVTSAETFNGGNVHLSASLLTGTYYIRLSRIGGEGTYTLSLSNLNTDRGGPAGSPTNLDTNGSFHGETHITDTVSATDVDDYYRIDLDAPGTIMASFPATALNTAANLQLGRDLNGNGQIDAGEQIALSNNPANAAQSIVANNLASGTYLLRVYHVAGTPLYDLTINADYAGATVSTARRMSLTGAGASTSEFVGPGDTTDYFLILTSAPLQLNAFFDSVTVPITVSVGEDSNGDGVVDAREAIFTGRGLTGSNSRVAVNLPAAGKWILSVSSSDPVGTNYGITLASAPVDNAGNSESDARDLGVLGAPQSLSDFVGDGSISAANDIEDFYRFTAGTSGPYVFVEQTPFATGQAIIQLIHDANSDGVIDPGEVVATAVSPAANTPPPPLVVTLIDPGTYYIHVLRFSGEVSYGMTVQAISTDNAGSTTATAALLGTLGPGAGSLTASGFVGHIDNDDLYLVNISAGLVFSTTPVGELSVTLTGAAAPAYVTLTPISTPTVKVPSPSDFITNTIDGTSNTLTFGEVTSDAAPTDTDIIQGLVVTPQIYLVNVHSDVDTTYNLSVSLSPELPFLGAPAVIDGGPLGTGNTIEAENFDRGGEGVAYHDTTPTVNTGGAYRPNEGVDIFANPSGGFRVDDTRAGEFLAYTLFAAINAQYDIDVSCAAASPGAAFHLEVDGSPVGTPNQLSVPATGSTTNFATVTTHNILLTQGPHVLRLVMDTPTSASASVGAFDSITIRRSQQSIGSFVLSPQNSSVPASGIATLSLQWTVPGTSWHDLNTIDLRLRDANGIAMWLRFDEATRSVSLYNDHSHKFGPARKIGDAGMLSNGQVEIDVSAIGLLAAGADSPTVELTFPIRFLHRAQRHLLVEIAATDDAGHLGDFITGGTLDI